MESSFKYSEVPARKTRFGYWLSLPAGYGEAENAKYPLIIFLHGAGERGENPALARIHGIPKLIDRGVEIPAVILCPQCADDRVWDTQAYELKALIDLIAGEYPIDRSKISLTGLSMGGFGTWMMGIAFPGFFARLAPVCGGGMGWLAARLKDAEIRAFHGSADTVVLPERSREMVDAVNAAGGRATLTVFDGVGHDSWVGAYETGDLADWLAFKV